MRRSVSLAGLVATLVLGIGACGAGQKAFVANAQQNPAAMEVKIDNFSFGPASLTVPVGTTVTWINHDDIRTQTIKGSAVTHANQFYRIRNCA